MSPAEPKPRLRHLEYAEFIVGESVPFGRMKVTREDIVRYARAFDPQPFHLSEETAKDSNIGRLIASGYHTCCIMMRMLTDDLIGGSSALGSPGLDEVRFLKPVLPDDILTGLCTTLDKRELRSKPGVGLLHCKLELMNGGGDAVMSWDMKAFRKIEPVQSGPKASGSGVA